MDRRLFELSLRNEERILSPESKFRISFPQLWGLVIIVFTIATSYALTLFAVHNLTTNVDVIKNETQNVRADISILKTDVRELKTDVQDLTNDIHNLQSSIEKLITSVADHKDMRETLIVQDSLMLKKIPPRAKHLYFGR